MEFIYFKENKDLLSRQQLVDFLHEHLIRFRDPKEQINNCLDYVMSEADMAGGFILCAVEDKKLLGIVVMNETGMSGYIPENYLVYAAVHGDHRGRGIGTELIKRAIAKADGDVALHVEYDNPAKKLYERIGFNNKYAEMRYEKQD